MKDPKEEEKAQNELMLQYMSRKVFNNWMKLKQRLLKINIRISKCDQMLLNQQAAQ